MTKHPHCVATARCQGLGADQCPDCDSFECEVSCYSSPPRRRRMDAQVLPTYPFAPGVIEGAPVSTLACDDDCYLPLSRTDAALILLLIALLSVFAGYLVERLA